ncbi:MAG: type II toxin-antitoxin system RelB/DinJ family antitoxin [Candidatus Gracilibacteria bacterium]
MASKSAMIRARIEPKAKNDAECILRHLGLNPTDAISIFYRQIVIKKGIPFSLDLEEEDISGNYIPIKSNKHLKSILKLK